MASDAHAVFKEQAALRAVAGEVRDGMVVGLGTGSTAAFVLKELARRIRDDRWHIQGIPTSERTAAEARRLGISLTTLDAVPDVVLDGTDQLDPVLNLVKGGGGAHAREKLVALASRRVVIVGDYTKAVPSLHGPVPVEVLAFGLPWVMRVLQERIPGSRPQVRLEDGRPAFSDNGNMLVDVLCGPLDDPQATADLLDSISGIVDHGLFIGIADVAYLAGPDGVRRLVPPTRSTARPTR
jgi:ribose 5-phosphate isomerase A